MDKRKISNLKNIILLFKIIIILFKTLLIVNSNKNLKMIQTIFVYGFFLNIVNIPYDNGANIQGSRNAYNILKHDINKSKKIKINKVYEMDGNIFHPRVEFGNAFLKCWDTLNSGFMPFLVGGDHTCAISSIFASNEYSLLNNEKLGVLWIDAHADFNTMESSPSKNLHGMPVSILCGHTLPMLSFGKYLSPSQFLYYGIRDIDSIEFDRFQKYNMNTLDIHEDLCEWIDNFDKIHISFDLDALDPNIFKGVNTPVKNGLTIENIEYVFDYVKNSGKLQSLDLVEYNPENGENNKLIINLLEKLF